MTLVDFFDPGSLEHIRAYWILQNTGAWPPEFWEKISKFDFPSDWQIGIMMKITKAFVEEKMDLRWIAGEDRKEWKEWQFHGIFGTKEEAVKVCKDEKWFVAPIFLKNGEEVVWRGVFYPFLKRGKDV